MPKQMQGFLDWDRRAAVATPESPQKNSHYNMIIVVSHIPENSILHTASSALSAINSTILQISAEVFFLVKLLLYM